MYIEYTTRNLKEYHKIVDILESCKNTDHFETVKNVVEQFGKNCDYRDSYLKKRAWKTLSLKAYKEYREYNKMAHLQVDQIVSICNMWAQQYRDWEEAELKVAEEEKEESKKMPPKKPIVGFGCLMKKNKRKKNE